MSKQSMEMLIRPLVHFIGIGIMSTIFKNPGEERAVHSRFTLLRRHLLANEPATPSLPNAHELLIEALTIFLDTEDLTPQILTLVRDIKEELYAKNLENNAPR